MLNVPASAPPKSAIDPAHLSLLRPLSGMELMGFLVAGSAEWD